ncbi:MAG: aminoacyl-tRNA hydrolase [Clostridia bacterium]|nr:aminoacyl-tRNA hydrolase [Clostridia bacterium]
MKIIFGLGNPEKKYFNTYHNIGFMFLESLADDFGLKFTEKSSLKSQVCELTLQKEEICEILEISKKQGKEKFVFVKPLTYMNLSGDAVRLVMKKYNASLEDIVVVLDDVDLPVGSFRFREKGSAGTHNGLRDIVAKNGTDFKRLRIGIGSAENKNLLEYVLKPISKENLTLVEDAINESKKFLFEKIL